MSLITGTKIISKLSEYSSVSMQVSISEDFIVYSNHENTLFFILYTKHIHRVTILVTPFSIITTRTVRFNRSHTLSKGCTSKFHFVL